MNFLNKISIAFIVAFVTCYLISASYHGTGYWGIPFSSFIFLLLIPCYALFWIICAFTSKESLARPIDKILFHLPALVFAVSLATAFIKELPPLQQFTLHVADSQNQPVSGATIKFTRYGKDKGTAITDDSGYATWTGYTASGPQFTVEKSGFYRSEGDNMYVYNPEANNPKANNPKAHTLADPNMPTIKGIWPFKYRTPWNRVIEVPLRRIINPTPLYAKNFSKYDLDFLKDAKSAQFDLLEGDWIAPNGSGKEADITLTLFEDLKGSRNIIRSLRIDFNGQVNGIQEIETNPYSYSMMLLPHDAPVSGYRQSIEIEHWDITYNYSKGYFFRTRSLKVNNDIPDKALYGKVLGPIVFKTDRTGKLRLVMNYCLNDRFNDTNLEFDSQNNLFTGEAFKLYGGKVLH